MPLPALYANGELDRTPIANIGNVHSNEMVKLLRFAVMDAGILPNSILKQNAQRESVLVGNVRSVSLEMIGCLHIF